MRIIDLTQDFNNEAKQLWSDAIKKIQDGNDALKENYVNLNPEKFLCFPVLIENDQIICFSGLQQDTQRWGECARINARMWICPQYRHNYLTKMSDSERFFNTRYLLPIQLKRAQELNIDTVFISRGGDYRRFLNRYCDLIQLNTGITFNVLEHRYNVCGQLNPVPSDCSQLIAVHSFSNSMKVWNNNMSQYQL
jgi:hypothetical protein